ncbi:MAG: DUF1501 domain-containing protein [Verrucomicrobiaceae bacterium]|nr:DUF1501 domain-containing protein [Verrucomicrobiaceae bacterium]
MASGTLQHPTLTRRSMISAGAVGLMNLGLEHLTGLRALAGPSAPAPKAKSVIYIFLSGGLAQHESFDMKPDAPREIRGEFRPISTRTPGIQICEHLPRLARLSNKWALLRSLTHPHSEHSQGHHVMLTGRSDIPVGFDPTKSGSSDWPSIAALANAALARTNNLPPALVMPDKLIHRTGRVIPGQFGGMMGAQADPWFVEMSPYRPEHYGAFPEYLFHHEKGFQKDGALAFRPPQLSLPEDVTLDRMRSRIGLRDQLEKQAADLAKLNGDPSFDAYREAAVGLLSNEKVHTAFSLAKVDERRLDAYGRNSFGWSLLVARQLVEAGTRLIQVNLGNNETWDTHQSAWPNLKNYLLPPMDRAVAALIEDLDASGLLDETLIVMGSEFGRTPKISTLPGGKALPGRDHWGHVQSIFFAGGGIKGGNVIGSSDKNGGYPETDAQTPENLAATIYDALGIPKARTWLDLAHRPHLYYEGEPIKGLM